MKAMGSSRTTIKGMMMDTDRRRLGWACVTGDGFFCHLLLILTCRVLFTRLVVGGCMLQQGLVCTQWLGPGGCDDD